LPIHQNWRIVLVCDFTVPLLLHRKEPLQLAIRIDLLSTETLQGQIVEQIHDLIRDGQLQPGSAVPSSRELSQQLHVSRNTVVEAYELLIDDGYLYTQHATGTFVSKTLPEDSIAEGRTTPPRRAPSRRSAVNLPLPYAGGGLPGLHKPADPTLLYDFALGRTDARSFPEKIWRRLILDCLGGASERMSQYNDPAGLRELRQLITNFLGPARGMVVSPEQILIVAGCQQGLNLAAHLFVGTNTPVVMESPCYRGAAFLFESYGAKILPVPVDELGIDVAQLPEDQVKLVCVTPSHQFPTGVTMSFDRRIALLEWAARIGAYILEVDYDADFRYEDSPLPSLQALDRNGCVIYMSSFSRSIGPGLRLGYVVVPRDLIGAATTIKGLIDNGSPWLEQATLAQFIRDGSLVHHLKRLRHKYKGRRDALVTALHHHFGEVDISGVEAGMHLLWRLPRDFPPAQELQVMARAHGVGVYSLQDSPAYLYEQMKDHDRILLLGYTLLTEEQIEQGIAGLAAALRG
jgi:GntR family transcriptional regulator/MocR family aminotransferase